MEVIFLGFLIVGAGYLLLMIFSGLGDALDLGVDGAMAGTGLDTLFGLDFDVDAGSSDVSGIGCSVLAAFFAGFGAVGLTGTASGWNLLVVLAVSIIGGYMIARGAALLLKYVLAQQSTDSFSSDSLIGKYARVTINSDAGKTGEVIIEEGQTLKYPATEINGVALSRGDIVEVVDVAGRFLRVKKK